MPGNKEIDDILNAALDELEDDSDDGDSCVDGDGAGDGVDQHKTSTERNKSTPQNDDKTSRPVFGPPRPPSISEEEKAVMDMMHQMENLFPSEDFGIDGNTHVNLNHGHDKKTSEKNNEQEGQESEPDMNDAVTQLLHKLSNNDEINENGGSGNFGGLGDEMTENMMKEFESTMKGIGPSSFGGDEEDGMGDVVDGMMKQLLSKEFMYEPMKDICERFPTWLAENKEKLSPEDYEK
jgi:peroxin-19